MEVADLLLVTSVPVILTVVLVLVMLVALGGDGGPRDLPHAPAPAFAAVPARLRLVAIAREAELLRVDGIVHETGPGMPVATGTPITLEIGIPDSFWLDLSIERLMETWAADDRVIDVVVTDHPSGRVASLRSGKSVVNLSLVGDPTRLMRQTDS